ncbi:MAG: MBL fold metallo-hydrolase [Candidatus Aenigmatarchaeota archaeon]
MAEVKVLVEGYAKETEEGWKASSTTTLIKDNGINVIVDPGSNKELLIEKLMEEGLKPEDIDLIFLTHYHLDHIINIRLFPDCDVLDGGEVNRDDESFRYSGKIPGTDIDVIYTPGHADEHCSLLIKTDKGNIVIAGDLFWWKDGEEQKIDIEKDDQAHPADMKKIIESRKKILEMADYIIPGHGKMFKVKK